MDRAFLQRVKAAEKLREQLQSTEKNLTKEVMSILKVAIINSECIEGFKWRQYIPGFNDGEPCLFTLDGPYIKLNENLFPQNEEHKDGYYQVDYDLTDGFFEEKEDILNFEKLKSLKKEIKAVYKAFEIISNMEKPLEDFFGINVEVIVTKDGVEIEDYDCGY